MKVKDEPKASISAYEDKKGRLVNELQSLGSADKNKIALNKTTSNLFRPKTQGASDHKIDVRSFNSVIDVDAENLVAHVEGMTTYETLVDETLKKGCLPTVVPELKSITIGGAVSGCGIESSSFLYGLVHETIESADVLLGDGSIVKCTRDNEHRDLFYAFPNTFGTLGYALSVEVPLIQAKPYVKLTHLRYDNAEKYFEALNALCRDHREKGTADYIDGVIFSPKEMYVTIGQFVDEAPYASNYRYMNIYYQSIRKRNEDYLTALDYIWRWDPDWFWCSKVFCLQNPITRFLLGKAMLSSKVYGKIMHFFNRHSTLWKPFNAIRGPKESIIQDIAIPVDRAEEFLAFFNETIGITPIWICPTKAYRSDETFDFCPMDPKTLYLDFGFWDAISTDKEDGFYNKKIEGMTRQLNGFKSLYSSSYYTEEEFWEIYDRNQYQKIKSKYDSDSHFRDLYTKCTTR